MALTSARLLELRADAQLERETALERKVRGGQDPADAYDEVPSVEELMVFALRDEQLEARGQLAEFALAKLAARAGGPDAASHKQNADRVEFEILRAIALEAPELTVAIWGLGHRIELEP